MQEACFIHLLQLFRTSPCEIPMVQAFDLLFASSFVDFPSVKRESRILVIVIRALSRFERRTRKIVRIYHWDLTCKYERNAYENNSEIDAIRRHSRIENTTWRLLPEESWQMKNKMKQRAIYSLSHVQCYNFLQVYKFCIPVINNLFML